jgi:hypothetical protein
VLDLAARQHRSKAALYSNDTQGRQCPLPMVGVIAVGETVGEEALLYSQWFNRQIGIASH